MEDAELRRLVLQPEDLPRAFTGFDEGRQAPSDTPGGSRVAPDRLLILNGLIRGLTVADAFDLARKQQARIADAGAS